MTENVVEVKNLTHYYGKKLVYQDLNFSIRKGSIFGLLGKNGTGKTTTINILNGFLKPASGHCLI
ncbi:MAG: ATP-binding cassette domain-containing protein, partial [Syntrophothermus sp.]